MMSRALALLRSYVHLVRRRDWTPGLMFASRSSFGRPVKIFLFGLGVLLPLGSVIWALLLWHGNGVRRYPALEARCESR